MAGAHHAREIRIEREGTRLLDFGFSRQKTLNDKVSLSEYGCIFWYH
jgi:hypothetical protein